MGRGNVFKGKGKAVNTKHDIFKRRRMQGFFRMLHMRTDYDHIIFANRKFRIFGYKRTAPMHDIKQLTESVGV